MTLFVMDTKTLQKSFGMRCKELRAGLGYSQEQFANLLRWIVPTTRALKSDEEMSVFQTSGKIANGFNMSIAALMTGVTEKTD